MSKKYTDQLAGEHMEPDSVVSLIENRLLTPEEIGLLASLITEEPDHYTVLGVDQGASNEDIQRAYCLAVENFHPLKSREITESDSVMHWKLSRAFIRIEEAFTVLSHRGRRKAYDEQLVVGQVQLGQHRQIQSSLDPRLSQGSKQPAPDAPAPEATIRRSHELRRVERVRLKLPVRVSLDRHWQELAETMDVSPLGVRLLMSRPVEPGSELRIELPMPKSLRTHSYDDDVYVVNAFVLYVLNHESGQQVVAEFI